MSSFNLKNKIYLKLDHYPKESNNKFIDLDPFTNKYIKKNQNKSLKIWDLFDENSIHLKSIQIIRRFYQRYDSIFDSQKIYHVIYIKRIIMNLKKNYNYIVFYRPLKYLIKNKNSIDVYIFSKLLLNKFKMYSTELKVCSYFIKIKFLYYFFKTLINDLMSLTLNNQKINFDKLNYDTIFFSWGVDFARFYDFKNIYNFANKNNSKIIHLISHENKITNFVKLSNINNIIYKLSLSDNQLNLLNFELKNKLKIFIKIYNLKNLKEFLLYGYFKFKKTRQKIINTIFIEKLIKKGSRVIISDSDSFVNSNIKAYHNKKQNFKIYIIQHGVFLYDQISANYSQNYTYLVHGSLFKNLIRNHDKNINAKIIGNKFNRLNNKTLQNRSKNLKIVISTRSNGGRYSSYCFDKSTYPEKFEKLIFSLKKSYDNITIKSHPNGDLYNFYDYLKAKFSIDHIKTNWRLRNNDLYENCDVLINFSEPTGLTYEAINLNIPVIFIDNSNKTIKKYLNFNLPNFFYCNPEDIVNKIKLIYEKDMHMIQQKKFLKKINFFHKNYTCEEILLNSIT